MTWYSHAFDYFIVKNKSVYDLTYDVMSRYYAAARILLILSDNCEKSYVCRRNLFISEMKSHMYWKLSCNYEEHSGDRDNYE